MSLSELPPRSIFPAAMLRYPNLWFFIDQELVLRGEYAYAVRFLVEILEQRLKLRDSFMEEIENHNVYHLLNKPGEGSDFQARIGPVQRFVDPENPGRSHWHQLHARFYCSPLINAGLERIQLSLDGTGRDFFLIPASVHYEVAIEEPRHPYEDSCPFCGITGEYDLSIDHESQDYCVKIHDPLGLEFLLYGKIRGKRISWDKGKPVNSITDLVDNWNCRVEEYSLDQGEPRRLATVSFLP